MASEITIPRLGWNMDEGIFVGWLKADGQPVKAGEPLFNLEGDKATQEIESLENRHPAHSARRPQRRRKSRGRRHRRLPGRPRRDRPRLIPRAGRTQPSSPSPLVGEVPPQAAVGVARETAPTPRTRHRARQKQPISPRAPARRP